MEESEARTIASAVVDEAFLRLGIDASTHEAVTEMQADFQFVRRQRLAADALKANALKALISTIGVAIVGLGSWLIAGLAWKGHP